MGKWITPTMDVIVLGDRLYKTLTVIEYEADDGKRYKAPIGTVTNFGSTWGTLIAAMLDGIAQMACTMHDYHYESGCVSRKKADQLLRESSYAEFIQQGKEEEEARDLADTFYYGVRLFGGRYYNDKGGK